MNKPRIIPRAAGQRLWLAPLLIAASLLLGACSTTRLAYNQAPGLAQWWINGQVNLSDAQSTQLREDIDRFFQWHRRSELPAYAALLLRWQSLATTDISAEQACAEFDRMRARIDVATERSLEPLARLALQLSPEQLQYLQKKQADSLDEFDEDYLQGDTQERQRRRLDKAVDRSEQLYGRLNEAQRELVASGIRRSSFDAERSRTERLRRQDDLRQTVRAAQSQVLAQTRASDERNGPGLIRSAQAATLPSATATAVPLLRDFTRRLWASPAPGYQAYSQTLVRQGCAQFAALHNSTSPAQRAHAVDVLKGYAADFQALSRAQP